MGDYDFNYKVLVQELNVEENDIKGRNVTTDYRSL